MFDWLFSFDGGVIAVIIPIVIIALLFAYAASRVKVAGANEALVRTGGVFGGAPAQLKAVRAGRVIVLPLVHKLGRLHLSARQINVNLGDAVTKQGIKVAVQGVATVKIGGDEESIRNAAERFLDRDDQIEPIVKNVLEGSLRSIVGTLTVEELNYDRQKFQQEVQSAAKSDLATSGLTIDNFTIQAIRDEVGYMDLIGQQETARRERDARMAKALADQEAAVREAEATQIKLNAQRDVSLRTAEVEALTASAEAKAAQAGPLAQAEAQQEVVRRQTELAQLEADRRQKELIATTVRPAEAEAEAQIRRAEGDKQSRIAAAQAEAERVKLAGQAEAAVQVTKGEAQARVTEVNAEAIAKQTTLEGNAEAGITFTKGEAEAKALALRADAYRQFNEAAIISTVLAALPEIVRAAAEPMASIDSLTVLSTDGASDVVKNATRTVTEASATVKGLTGIDIPQLLNDALGTTRARRPMSRRSRSAGRPVAAVRAAAPRPAAPVALARRAAVRGFRRIGAAHRSGAEHRRRRRRRPATHERDRDARLDRLRAGRVPPPRRPRRRSGWRRQRPPWRPRPTAPPPRPCRISPACRRRCRRCRPCPMSGPPTAVAPRTAAAGAIGLDEASTLSDSAVKLAQELQRVPGIERFGGTRLRDLERSGPRTLRTLWGAARDELETRYGDVTIGMLLDEYERSSGGGAPGPSH